MQAEAIATTLAPEGGLLANGVQIIQEEATMVITADRIVDEAKEQLLIVGRELVKNLPDLSLATNKWLNQYKKGRFEVTLDTSELAKEVDKLGRFGRQVIIAIILVGMLIGTAISTASIAFAGLTGQFWDFMIKVSYIGFILAMIIAAFILFRLVWRWIRGKNYYED